MDTYQPIEFKRTYLERQDPKMVDADYDRALDTLFIDLKAPQGPRSTYYIADGVNVVFDPTTNEVTGFQVEDWRVVFLRRHSDLRPHWYWYRLLCGVAVLCRWLGRSVGGPNPVLERVEEIALSPSPA